MPPSMVKSIRDLIYWQYAKLIAKSAHMEQNYGFITSRFKKLTSGEIVWSSSIREYIKEHDKNECIYCGSQEKLTLEHILPTSRGGPNIPENAVWVCKTCNSSKGANRLYEWYGLDNNDNIPRIAEGKYLKLLYDLHENNGTLNISISELQKLCKVCDLEPKCPEKQKLTIYCLEGFLKKNK